MTTRRRRWLQVDFTNPLVCLDTAHDYRIKRKPSPYAPLLVCTRCWRVAGTNARLVLEAKA